MNPAATDPGTATSELGARIRPFIVPQQWRIGLTGRHLELSYQEEQHKSIDRWRQVNCLLVDRELTFLLDRRRPKRRP